MLDIELFDWLDGAGIRALLRDLAFAVSDLASCERPRVVIPTEASSSPGPLQLRKGAVWEVGLERDGASIQTSVFCQGVEPSVGQPMRSMDIASARDVLLIAIARHQEGKAATKGDLGRVDRGLALARSRLEALVRGSIPPSDPPTRQRVDVSSGRRARLGIRAIADVRSGTKHATSEVARSDLHALLFRGSIQFSVGQSVRRLQDLHVFLFVERLLKLSIEVLDAQSGRRGMTRRVSDGDALCGVRLDETGKVTVMVGAAGDQVGWRLPEVPWQDFVRAVAALSRRLAKAVVAADRTQGANLRVRRFRTQVAELRERLKSESARRSKLNPAPESYRAFAESDNRPPMDQAARPAPLSGRLRFDESWRADVPGIDLRSIFLCGDRLVIAAARELACIERSSGHLLWTRRTHRAVSLLTPAGLVRLGADGTLVMHDLRDGDPVLELKLGACAGASTSGTVVATPGLPHMILVAEGARHLAAVDLDSGEVRWRRAVRRSGALRLGRAGKLMVVASGEPQLVGLDLLSGEVVWRRSRRRRYAHGVSLDAGELYALSSETPSKNSAVALENIDPFSGKVRWCQMLPRPVSVQAPPVVSASTVVVLTRDAGGERLGAIGLDKKTGELRFDLPGGLCEGRGGMLLFDELLIVNGERGELVALELPVGRARYRHVFAGWTSRCDPSDRPHSVQPILRSGALFVPQSELYVVRPGDGTMLGRVPCDLVPDAVRVDERCGVYVAEASGYLAAYHALPLLTLVKAL